VIEDRPDPATRADVDAMGAELCDLQAEGELASIVAGCDLVVPSPGVPPRHPVFALAGELGVVVSAEIEVAAGWATSPMVAVTGTNGKTTVTELTTAMLLASGRRARAAGNIGLSLADAVRLESDVLVVEASSFQLEFSRSFRPAVAVWLNVALDHLDWHPDPASYVAAKARIWANLGPEGVAVANVEDRSVMSASTDLRCPVVTFGAGGFYHSVDGRLWAGEEPIIAVAEMWRSMPHDVANALAAAAAAMSAGATLSGVAEALRRFAGLPHRMTQIAEADGVRWYDDSKATNPHAVLAAVRGFDSVVLIAGGRNKGVDLRGLAATVPPVHSVVAIGEAAEEIRAVFAATCPVAIAASMEEAVDAAASAARPGDAVVLSPGCASFDWYRSYAERGDDFTAWAERVVAGSRR